MFGKGNEALRMGKVDTILGDGTEVQGGVVAKGTIRIDGRIEGGVVSEDGIIIGETGIVKGDLTARFIILGGKVTGDLHAQTRVELLPTAQLYGDIRAPRLIIAEGVIFEGTCDMMNEKAESESKTIKK